MRSFVADPAGEPGMYTHTKVNRKTGVEAHSHTAHAATQTVRSLCARCNNGWMSQIETGSQTFITTMLRGHGRTFYEHGQTVIATWLVKTALVAGSKIRPAAPSEFYSQFYAARRPSANTRVWLAATPERQMHTMDFRTIRVSEGDKPLPDQVSAFSSVISVGNFAGFVVSWLEVAPSLDQALPAFGDALLPIWPLTSRGVAWPPKRRLDLRGLDALAETIARAVTD